MTGFRWSSRPTAARPPRRHSSSRPVQAGAYEYRLYRGGQGDANGWYLRSQLDPSDPGDPIHPSGGGDRGNNGNGNGGTLAYRPGVSGYALTPLLNADYGFSTLGKLHERVGDVYNLEKQQPGNRDGVWGASAARASTRMRAASADERTFFAQFGRTGRSTRHRTAAAARMRA